VNTAINSIVGYIKDWKQSLTTDFGPDMNMYPEISMFDAQARHVGDLTFTRRLPDYDFMHVGLGLAGMAITMPEVKYMVFATETLLSRTESEPTRRDDGTIVPLNTEQLISHHTDYDTAVQSWIKGDDRLQNSVLIVIADLIHQRTWCFGIPFHYDLGNRVIWADDLGDSEEGPDYRSQIFGMMLLPALIGSQTYYMQIRPDIDQAIDHVLASGFTMMINDGSETAVLLGEAGIELADDSERQMFIDAMERKIGEIASQIGRAHV
jgi:hypothetical protein